MNQVTQAFSLPFRALIWVYQQTLSPDHGPLSPLFPYGYCRFHPSCSQYGMDAYKQHGVIKGTILTSYRILRCNPINPGGGDEVPKDFKEIRKYHINK